MSGERNGHRGVRRGFRKVHTWLGLGAGLLVMVTTVSGLLLQYPGLLGEPAVKVTTLAVNPDRPDHLLRGTTAGLEVSGNGGLSWHEVPMLMPPGEIRRVLFDGPESSRVFVLGKDGLVRSDDGGRIWEPLYPDPGESAGWQQWVDLVLGADGSLMIVSEAGLQISGDGGLTWEERAMPTTVPENAALKLVHDLHTGYWAGPNGPKLVTLGALSLVILVLSGFYLGLVKRNGKARNG
jgi:hypothetical protein